MYPFEYYIQFYERVDRLHIAIYLHLDPQTVTVYKRSFPNTIFHNREEFLHVYYEIEPYFHQKQIVMSKEDLHFLNTAFSSLPLTLPTVRKVKVADVAHFIQGLTLNELTPKELLLLQLLDGKRYASYLKRELYEAYRMDSDYALYRLESLGYLVSDDLAFSLFLLPYKEWVALLEAVQNRRKDEPRERVIEELLKTIDQDKLWQLVGDPYIRLTPKGKAMAEGAPQLLDFHNHLFRYEYHLSIDEYFILSQREPSYTPVEVMKLLIVNQNKDRLDRFDWKTIFQDHTDGQIPEAYISSQFAQILLKYTGGRNADDWDDSGTEADDDLDSIARFYDILFQSKEEKKGLDQEPDETTELRRIIQQKKMQPNSDLSERHEKDDRLAKRRKEHERLRRMVVHPAASTRRRPSFITWRLFLLSFLLSAITSLLLLYIWFTWLV